MSRWFRLKRWIGFVWEVRRRGGKWPSTKRIEYVDWTPELAKRGLDVRGYRVDVQAFHDYVERSGYRELEYWQGGARAKAAEKYLEHYVSLELTRPQPGEVLVDIASCDSPFPEIAARLTGATVFRQDLIYPPGANGDRLGGDATNLPVGDGSVDVMTLHCSFEHFEGSRDIDFLREASRVLRPGGRVCILPLYTTRRYLIETDPWAWGEREVRFERNAVVALIHGWGEVHGRFYDRRRFERRILRHLGDLTLEVYRVENLDEVGDGCYLKLAAVLRKPGSGPLGRPPAEPHCT